jgi:quinol monooxygenase YgiN
VRFAAHQDQSDPRRIVLIEAYREAADFDRHKETAHYQACLAILPDLIEGAPNTVRFSPLPSGVPNGKGTLS